MTEHTSTPALPDVDAGGASPTPASGDETPRRVPWLAVSVFAALACGLAWLVQVPVWLSGEGLRSPLFLPLTAVMMFTPTIAALVATFLIVKPRHPARFLGLTPLRPVWSKLGIILAWPFLFFAIGVGATLLAGALGWVELDFSLAAVRAQLPDGTDVTMWLVVTILALPLSMVMGTLTAVGEEIGWRGFLVPALAPLGFWPAALVSGVLWGVWHAPVILLGYNFQRPDAFGLLLMCGFTTALGVLLQWSRYATRSVWPAAFGHGAINGVAPVTFLLLAGTPDAATGTILGVPGWALMMLAIGIVALCGGFGARVVGRPLVEAPAPTRVQAASPGAAPAGPRDAAP